jgi:hypothetical protein
LLQIDVHKGRASWSRAAQFRASAFGHDLDSLPEKGLEVEYSASGKLGARDRASIDEKIDIALGARFAARG